jgi:hypothetical protein
LLGVPYHLSSRFGPQAKRLSEKTSDLSFQCRCGAVHGTLRGLTPGHGIRFVCCCDDCQVYAHHLGRGDILDANGGTDVYHADSSRLRIAGGLGRLAAVKVARISSRPVLRWYCSVCRSPLFNTYDTSRRSLFGLILVNARPQDCDAILGPATGIIWRKFARGDAGARKNASLPAIVKRLFVRQISARLSGDYRNTPLFDRHTGLPIAKPHLLSPAERAAAEENLRGKRG